MRSLSLLLLSGLVLGCGGSGDAETFNSGTFNSGTGDSEPVASEAAQSTDTLRVDPEGPLVVFLGNSLTAGFGLSEQEAFPHLLGRRLREAGSPIRVVNAGVSGDTSVGGRSRLDWVLRQEPEILVVELGANDGLRGQELESTRSALEAIVSAALDRGCLVLLLGMKVPPNYGPLYTRAFESIFVEISEELDVPLVPFLLEGVGGDPDLNQADGIHPTADGHEILADNVLPYLAAILSELD